MMLLSGTSFRVLPTLDAAVALAKGAGFDVSKADWLKYQAKQTLELSDEELEGVTGGSFFDDFSLYVSYDDY
jgi:predicted ribosomally synthesized peptide with nif11-like leader